MLCADDDHTRVFLTGGFLGTADIVDHLVDRLGVDADSIHAPARFGLPVRADHPLQPESARFDSALPE